MTVAMSGALACDTETGPLWPARRAGPGEARQQEVGRHTQGGKGLGQSSEEPLSSVEANRFSPSARDR